MNDFAVDASRRLYVNHAQEATNNLVRCERCFGRGYQGRWRHTARGRAWKLETCQGCGGRGERPAPTRKRQ